MLKIQPGTFDWGFWFFWMMATSVGWILGRFVLPNLSLIVIGFSIGTMQWFVLQSRIPRAWRWILVTAIGWAAGSILIIPFRTEGFEIIVGSIIGLSTGISQLMVLRNEVFFSGWWLLVMLIAWTSGIALFPGILLTGVVVGIITGIGLELLFRNPKPKPVNFENET